MPSTKPSPENLTLPFGPYPVGPIEARHEFGSVSEATASDDLLSASLDLLSAWPEGAIVRDENAPIAMEEEAEDGSSSVSRLSRVLGLFAARIPCRKVALLLLGDEADPLVACVTDTAGLISVPARLLPMKTVRSRGAKKLALRIEDAQDAAQLCAMLGETRAGEVEVWDCVLPCPPTAHPARRGHLVFAVSSGQSLEQDGAKRLIASLSGLLSLALLDGALVEAIHERTRPRRVGSVHEVAAIEQLGKQCEYFDLMLDGILVLDEHFCVVWLNRKAVETTGYLTRGLSGKSLLEFVPPDFAGRALELLEQCRSTDREAKADFFLQSTSGDTLTLACTLSAIRNPKWFCVMAFQDVTERRVLEDKLRRANKFAECLLTTAAFGIVVVNSRGEIETFNRGASRITGYGQRVAQGMPVWRFFQPGVFERVLRLLYGENLDSIGPLSKMRLEILGKAGQTIPVDLTAVPVFEHGETAYFVAMFSDLLNVKNLESQVGDLKRELDLCFEDRDRLVQAAAKASHELDQPIQILLGAVTLMKGRAQQTVPTLVDVVDFLERELSRMVDVVRKTRDLPAFSPAPRRTAVVTAASVSPADGTSEESECWQSKQPADQTDRVREIQRIASLVVSTNPDDPDSAQNPSGGNP